LLGTQRRVRDGQVFDVIDYFFRVSTGESHRDVTFGIIGQSYDPPESVGPLLAGEQLGGAATAWLQFHLGKGFDPFNHPEAVLPDMPGAVVQYWVEHGEIPHWL